MLSRKTLLPMAIVAGLVVASPAPSAAADPRPAPAHAAGDPLATALTFALDRRDDAIEDVHTLAPATPPASEDDDTFVPPRPAYAHASGDAPTGSFDTIMPAVPAMLDEELQQISAILEDPEALLPAGADLLRTAAAQITKTERKAKAYWPPVAADEE
ncbi:MAG TPA: hypothetical protein VGM33_10170 [Baekduia sp.]|jgi:hypothetical protein